ncbi:MAG: Ppx/GppA phosphatase family protein [Rhodothermales bacterium]
MESVDNHAACLVNTQQYATDQEEQHPARICVIDLGTNSFHTLIVNVFPNGSFEVLDRIKEVVRLGERGLIEHRLTERAMKRAIRAIRRVKLLAEGWGAGEYLAFATSAIREADNGGDLIEKIKEETGIHVQVIDGGFEAYLIYEGVRRAVDMHEPTLMVDIGGGSTEFIIGNSEKAFLALSLKLGAARMTGQFITSDPISQEEFKALRAHFREMLMPVYAACREHGVRGIVGSSGTFENVAQGSANLRGNTDRSIYLQVFEGKELRTVTKSIIESSREERAAISGIEAKRVKQIVAGAMLIDVLLKDLEVERVRISPNALREGMVVHFVRRNNERLEAIAPFADVRRRSVYEMGHRFRWDEKHVEHVVALALQLFDACRELHGLGPAERELLEFACLLHDIGYYISRSSHHKHSLYLIKQADWHGFQPEEIDVMAHIARYHRRSVPRDKHTAYRRLSEGQRKLVRQLGSFLRLANALDRSHYQNVTAMRANLDTETLDIEIETKGDPQLEIWSARRASDMFESTFKRKVRIKGRVAEAATLESKE